MEEPVDPVSSSPRTQRPQGPLTPPSPSKPTHKQELSGVVTTVHRRSGHHGGEHILDTSVGAEEYNEIVIRVKGSELGHLVGKTVRLRF
ncbi:MAG: hypothetical protein QGG73_02985 [Candidatus Hydrogenedentes bacterium]|jgi:hypothetical protein|nr:hypothetical protein [Candidatus Hydrogenedentota bacterium]